MQDRLNVALGCSKTPFFGIFLELLPLHCVWGVCQGEVRFGPRRTFSESERLALWRPRRARGGLPLRNCFSTMGMVSKYSRLQIDAVRGAAKSLRARHFLKGLWSSQELPIYLKTVGTGMQVELPAANRIPVGGPPPRGRKSTQRSTS